MVSHCLLLHRYCCVLCCFAAPSKPNRIQLAVTDTQTMLPEQRASSCMTVCFTAWHMLRPQMIRSAVVPLQQRVLQHRPHLQQHTQQHLQVVQQRLRVS
jgi:hypothetical protein